MVSEVSVSAQPREHDDTLEPGSKGRPEAAEARLAGLGKVQF